MNALEMNAYEIMNALEMNVYEIIYAYVIRDFRENLLRN